MAGEDVEAAQLIAALQATTPLQTALEHVVRRQAEQQRRLAALELAGAAHGELLARVRALEDRMEAAAGCANAGAGVGSGPFAAVALDKRVAALEAAAARLDEDARRLKYTTADVSAGPLQRVHALCVPTPWCLIAWLKATAALTARTAPLPMQVLEPRMAAAEARLCGVSNLAGRLMALDALVEEVGMPVPQAEVGC